MIPAWIVEYAALLGRGLQTTLAILLISSVFGFVLAILVALARISKNKVIAKVSLFYTSVTRRNRPKPFRPNALAASIWPKGIAWIAARKISEA